ncbi:hypothetical protein Tco_0932812, partial [Tanacetum coccineum]
SAAAGSACLSVAHLSTRPEPAESTRQPSRLSGPQSADPAQPKQAAATSTSLT